MLVPLLGGEVEKALERYSVEWILEAMKIAVEANKRNWSYVQGILKRWEAEGREQPEEAPVKKLSDYD